VKINFFVFCRAPQYFNQYIITPSAFAVYADPDAMVLQQAGKCQRSKLEISEEMLLYPEIIML